MRLIEAIKEKYGYLDPGNTFINAYDFIHAGGTPVDALLYYELFCPRFEEVQNCVLLSSSLEVDGVKDSFAELLSTYKEGSMSREEFQQSVYAYAYEEILFMFNDRDCSEEAIYYLAHLIAGSWRAQLAYQFPQYSFEIVVKPNKPNEHELGPMVCIQQNLDHIK